MSLGDIFRRRFGVAEQLDKIQLDPETEQKTREYFASLKQPEDPKQKWTWDTLLGNFQEVYKEQNGVVYSGVDMPVLEDLCRYFTKDIAFIPGGKRRSFDKGLLLKGGYGVGKTSIMRCFKSLGYDFGMKSTISIVQMFDEEGTAIVKMYGNKKMDFYFDDMGRETMGKFYKKEQNVMKDIFDQRYYALKQHKIKTHISTNMSMEQVIDKYGDRMESIFHDMFNIFVFDGKDKRKGL